MSKPETSVRPVSHLAQLIHDECCADSTPCARWKSDRHRAYYQDRADAIVAKLSPEIGAASVSRAVHVILAELWS